jgi:hypothetical protein
MEIPAHGGATDATTLRDDRSQAAQLNAMCDTLAKNAIRSHAMKCLPRPQGFPLEPI